MKMISDKNLTLKEEITVIQLGGDKTKEEMKRQIEEKELMISEKDSRIAFFTNGFEIPNTIGNIFSEEWIREYYTDQQKAGEEEVVIRGDLYWALGEDKPKYKLNDVKIDKTNRLIRFRKSANAPNIIPMSSILVFDSKDKLSGYESGNGVFHEVIYTRLKGSTRVFLKPFELNLYAAYYGTDANNVNVIDRIKKLADQSIYTGIVTTSFLETRDPAVGLSKKLKIHCAINGVEKKFEWGEGEIFKIEIN
ncbi:MAG TPA: hypothetical protein VN922_05585 [Bacteroidia bacterium]|nr:hypothetical protein [Bacteroidia bacterium]